MSDPAKIQALVLVWRKLHSGAKPYHLRVLTREGSLRKWMSSRSR